MFPFSQLPRDLQVYLFKFRLDLLPVACRISRDFHQRLKILYLESIGNRPITGRETSLYLALNPSPIAYLQCQMTLNRLSEVIILTWNDKRITYRLNRQHRIDLQIERRKDRPVTSDVSDWGQWSLYTFYDLLQHRLSCCRWDPNYPRTFFLRYLHQIMEQAQRPRQWIVLYLSLFHLITLRTGHRPQWRSESSRYGDLGLLEGTIEEFREHVENYVTEIKQTEIF